MKEKLLSLIKNSTKSPWGGISSTRVSAYFLLMIIMTFAGVFLGIEMGCAIVALISIGKYHISNEAIIIFGSLLAHHLTLLGINKKSETSQLNNEQKLGITKLGDHGLQSTAQVGEEPKAEESVVQDVPQTEPEVQKAS